MKQNWFDTGRIEAISDGVFAIAMTLLVLDLKLPELKEPVTQQIFKTAMNQQWPHFISWLISFAILCRLWITQHSLLVKGDKKTRGFTTINFVFLGAVSFIPFPTSLISEHSDQFLSVVIFSLTFLVAGLALGGMWVTLEKERKVSDTDANVNRATKRVIATMPLIAIASCFIAAFDTRIGIAVWIALPFAGMVIRRKKAH